MKQQKTLKLSTKPIKKENGANRISISYGQSHGYIDTNDADFAELIEGFQEGFGDVQVSQAQGGTSDD